VTIEELLPADWPACARIYEEGLDLGTFEDDVPEWETWDATHLAAPRLVARENGSILGWAALAPVSRRSCYRGVAENSVYVGWAARGRGVGKALLAELVARSRPGSQTDVNRPSGSYAKSIVRPLLSVVDSGRFHAGSSVVDVTQPSWVVAVVLVTGPPLDGWYTVTVLLPRMSVDSSFLP